MTESPILLGLNIDHCATLRQARYRSGDREIGKFVEPDPLSLALAAERAGVHGITVHLREDRRHIQDADVWSLRNCIQTRLNLEMACTDKIIDLALDLKPDTVCLVPEKREELTTEGGLDVIAYEDKVGSCIERMSQCGIGVSLFIDPDPAQIQMAAKLKSPIIELHTGAFANSWNDTTQRMEEFKRLKEASSLAHQLGLTVNAGHGINYVNIRDICRLPWLHELNIGHSIISRALFAGIEEAVREMKNRMIGR